MVQHSVGLAEGSSLVCDYVVDDPGGDPGGDPNGNGSPRRNALPRRRAHDTDDSDRGEHRASRKKEGDEIKIPSPPKHASEWQAWIDAVIDLIVACARDGDAAYIWVCIIQKWKCIFQIFFIRLCQWPNQ